MAEVLDFGIQHRRGYVGTVSIGYETVTCGHRLHLKTKAARECAVAVAKRMLKNLDSQA